MNSNNARVLHASLDLLDRQLRDRNGVLCGNVDDLEVERGADGQLYVTHIVTGAGALAYRLRRRKLGLWLNRFSNRMADSAVDRSMVPMVLASQIGPAIDLAVDAEDLPTHDGERWARVHFVQHMPLRGRRARE